MLSPNGAAKIPLACAIMEGSTFFRDRKVIDCPARLFLGVDMLCVLCVKV